MEIVTADLWDEFAQELTFLNVDFRHFGAKTSFAGKVVTLKLYEDNTYVRKLLAEPGAGKVLVVDGGGSTRCALVGDNIAKLAMDNNWAGVIVYGCIRDAQVINQMQVAIKALGTCPVKSIKRDVGIVGEALIIEGTKINAGQYVYADMDGILLSDRKLV
ncbi:MAG TPA: putative 4-hydroxy-4-methyl-2-oxoglutarate aldolase [Microscillaceae bacterium]|nr:putative 4-hydroxy-4-methyl-2-oxoglutarate aldolase [Microscillaceae bacterium]